MWMGVPNVNHCFYILIINEKVLVLYENDFRNFNQILYFESEETVFTKASVCLSVVYILDNS